MSPEYPCYPSFYFLRCFAGTLVHTFASPNFPLPAITMVLTRAFAISALFVGGKLSHVETLRLSLTVLQLRRLPRLHPCTAPNRARLGTHVAFQHHSLCVVWSTIYAGTDTDTVIPVLGSVERHGPQVLACHLKRLIQSGCASRCSPRRDTCSCTLARPRASVRGGHRREQ